MVDAVLMVRAVQVLSVIVRMVRGFSGGGAGTMVVVMTDVFLMMGSTITTADEFREQRQNCAHTK